MARFKHTDTSQGQFLMVNLQEQLLLGSFEWTINYLIDAIDLSLFEKRYQNDERGAAAYPPGALLKIILYCYSKGIISSRKIEKACQDNIIVKALAQDCEPDHDTIATFVSTNSEAVRDLFTKVLLQCAELGLITGEMFALDGCKLPSNASKEWSGKISDLKKKKKDLEKQLSRVLQQHKELDKNIKAKKVQEPFRKTLGKDKERRDRHVHRIEAKLKKLKKHLSVAEPKIGPSGQEVQGNITDNESARIKSSHGYIQGYNGVAIADSGNQVIIAAEAVGSGSESGCFVQMLNELETNMKLVTKKKQPLKKSLVLADTALFSEDNLQEAKKRNIDVLIPDQQFRKRDPSFDDRKKYKTTNVKTYFGVEDFIYDKKKDCYICPAGKTLPYKCDIEFKSRGTRGKQYRSTKSVCSVCPLKEKCINRKSGKSEFRALFIAQQRYAENLSAKMRDKIDNPAYRELYSRRIQIVEPVFANIRHCKKMDRFTLRTQKKVNIQWQLFAIVHNMWKCIKPLSLEFGI